MDKFSVAAVVLAGSLLAFTDAPEHIRAIIDESVRTGRQLATAGDLRSMSTMLDAHLLKHGRYPASDQFERWMAVTFKENHLKDLAVDHWSRPYQYESTGGRRYTLRSLGEDGMAGTDDDMTITGP